MIIINIKEIPDLDKGKIDSDNMPLLQAYSTRSDKNKNKI